MPQGQGYTYKKTLRIPTDGLNLIDEKSGGRKSRWAVPLSTVQNVCIILNDF